jgi:hypothetical protein
MVEVRLRPAPLGNDAAVAFKLDPVSPVPIRRTFIDYAAKLMYTPTVGGSSSPLRTAPAAMGRSVSCDLDVRLIPHAAAADPASPSAPLADLSSTPGCSSCCSPTQQRQPEVAYKVSPVSSRAAWYWFWRGLNQKAKSKRVALNQNDDFRQASTSSDDEHFVDDWNDYSDEGGLPSIGSADHKLGTCRRCCFFPKGRCANGASCEFCHFSHDKRRTAKARSKHTKRRAQRQLQDFGFPSSAAEGAGADSYHSDEWDVVQLQEATLGTGELRVVQLQDAVLGTGQLQFPHQAPPSSYGMIHILS